MLASSGLMVTGTFRHTSARVVDLFVEGRDEPTGTTPNHRFWSEERQEFVPADALRIGERLAGMEGQPRVRRIVPRATPETVYNIEVHGTHVYRVSHAGVLVHNAAPCYRPGQKPKNAPPGTRKINEDNRTKDIVHPIKQALKGDGVGPESYVGVTPAGNIIVSNPDGSMLDLGHFEQWAGNN